MSVPTKPTVLFVCFTNAGKSAMPQHLMRHTAGEAINATSAGTHSKTGVNPVSAQTLAETRHRPPRRLRASPVACHALRSCIPYLGTGLSSKYG